MQPRATLILSLGMLLKEVDTSKFIVKLLAKAKEENAAFKFTKDVQDSAFSISEKFNRGEIEPNDFEKGILNTLGITKIPSDVFWRDLNGIITTGDIAKQLATLKKIADEYDTDIVLHSDTHCAHMQKIAADCEAQKVSLDTKTSPMVLEKLPLFTSFQTHLNRMDLIKQTINTIKSEEKKANTTTIVLLGDPTNIKDPTSQKKAKTEIENMAAWCQKNHVTLCLQKDSLEKTLAHELPKHDYITRLNNESQAMFDSNIEDYNQLLESALGKHYAKQNNRSFVEEYPNRAMSRAMAVGLLEETFLNTVEHRALTTQHPGKEHIAAEALITLRRMHHLFKPQGLILFTPANKQIVVNHPQIANCLQYAITESKNAERTYHTSWIQGMLKNAHHAASIKRIFSRDMRPHLTDAQIDTLLNSDYIDHITHNIDQCITQNRLHEINNLFERLLPRISNAPLISTLFKVSGAEAQDAAKAEHRPGRAFTP